MSIAKVQVIVTSGFMFTAPDSAPCVARDCGGFGAYQVAYGPTAIRCCGYHLEAVVWQLVHSASGEVKAL
jgi:hypothetical protein